MTAQPAAIPPWTGGILAGFDTETTGINPQTARIVTAAIVIHDPVNKKRYVRTWLVNPGVDIPLEATAVHGISTEEARENGEQPETAIPEILRGLTLIREAYGPVPLVIMNAAYDLTVLDRELRRHVPGSDVFGTPWLRDLGLPVIDPLVCDRALDKYRSGRRTLTAISAAYGVAISGAHTADGDTLCSIRLVRAMGRRHPRFGGSNPGSLHEWQRKEHREWVKHFIQFRQRSEPSFTADVNWPVIPAVPGAVALWPG